MSTQPPRASQASACECHGGVTDGAMKNRLYAFGVAGTAPFEDVLVLSGEGG